MSKLTDEAKGHVDKLQHLLEHEANGDIVKHAKYFRDKVVPAMAALREAGDAPRRPRAARRLAAADVPRDAVRQVTDVDGRQVDRRESTFRAEGPESVISGPFSFGANPFTAPPYVQGT